MDNSRYGKTQAMERLRHLQEEHSVMLTSAEAQNLTVDRVTELWEAHEPHDKCGQLPSEIEPRGPQAQQEVTNMAAELRAYSKEDGVLDADTLALRLWRAAKRKRPLRTWRDEETS